MHRAAQRSAEQSSAEQRSSRIPPSLSPHTATSRCRAPGPRPYSPPHLSLPLRQVAALDSFYQMMAVDSARAFYGPGEGPDSTKSSCAAEPRRSFCEERSVKEERDLCDWNAR